MKRKFIPIVLSLSLAISGFLPVWANEAPEGIVETGAEVETAEAEETTMNEAELMNEEAGSSNIGGLLKVSAEEMEALNLQTYLHPVTQMLFMDMLIVSNEAKAVFDYLISSQEQGEAVLERGAESEPENAAFQVIDEDIAGLEKALMVAGLESDELQKVKASWEEVKEEIRLHLETTDEDGIYDEWYTQEEDDEWYAQEEEDATEEDIDDEDLDEFSFKIHPLYEEAEPIFMQMSYDDRLKYLDSYLAVYEAGMNAIEEFIRSKTPLGVSVGQSLDKIAEIKSTNEELLDSLKDVYDLVHGYVWRDEQSKALIDTADGISSRAKLVQASVHGVYRMISLLESAFSWLK